MTEESWSWLVREILGARLGSNRDRFLTMATAAIADREVARLSEVKQAKALATIAIEAGIALGDASVSAARKSAFVAEIPRLLASVEGSLFDPILHFWELLLAPQGRVLGEGVIDAVARALGEQLSSPEPLLQWSAARGIPLLPAEVADTLARTHAVALRDPVIRQLALPGPSPIRKHRP